LREAELDRLKEGTEKLLAPRQHQVAAVERALLKQSTLSLVDLRVLLNIAWLLKD
jgi:hypothetical protein